MVKALKAVMALLLSEVDWELPPELKVGERGEECEERRKCFDGRQRGPAASGEEPGGPVNVQGFKNLKSERLHARADVDLGRANVEQVVLVPSRGGELEEVWGAPDERVGESVWAECDSQAAQSGKVDFGKVLGDPLAVAEEELERQRAQLRRQSKDADELHARVGGEGDRGDGKMINLLCNYESMDRGEVCDVERASLVKRILETHSCGR